MGAFGLAVESDFELPGFREGTPQPAGRALALRLDAPEELLRLVDEPRVLRYQFAFDGAPYALLEGPSGDVLMCYGDRALFHLSADRQLLRCAPTRRDDPTWQRVLLDTVLWTASLLGGRELLHASSVQTPGGVVAFVAGSGGGKTTLAVEHLRRGHPLFCDDILALEVVGDRVLGHPGPPLMNLPAALAGEFTESATLVADFGDEQWTELDATATTAQPLAAIVLLSRAPGLEARCAPLDGSKLGLLHHMVRFRHLAERERTRFELMATLTSTVPVLDLTADPSVTPAALADLVSEAL